MKLEDQVVSLELAIKLKELGIEQKSLFYFYNIGTAGRYEPKLAYEQQVDMLNDDEGWVKIASAFTVAELGEMLPHSFMKDGYQFYVEPSANGGGLKCISYIAYQKGGIGFHISSIISAHTEADARAKMLIYLIENKLMPANKGGE